MLICQKSCRRFGGTFPCRCPSIFHDRFEAWRPTLTLYEGMCGPSFQISQLLSRTSPPLGLGDLPVKADIARVDLRTRKTDVRSVLRGQDCTDIWGQSVAVTIFRRRT